MSERDIWQRMIQDLQDWKVTLEQIAEELNVSDRQVSNWKAGQRPTGMTAVNLYLFHMKRRRIIQGSTLPSEKETKAA